MEEYNDKILQILREINPYEDITEETELIETEILDSISILVLVSEIEEAYKIEIDEKMIIPEKFKSVNAIVELVKQLLGDNNNERNDSH